MSKKFSLVYLGLAAVLVGCESSPSTPPMAMTPTTKPAATQPLVGGQTTPETTPTSVAAPGTPAIGAPMKVGTTQPMAGGQTTAAAAPLQVPPVTEPKMTGPWDAPVDGRPVFMKIRAEGVQIYVCKKDDSGAYAWKWVAPEALLYDDKGRNVGKHGAGPSWELTDGSKVVGEKIGEMAQKDAIPFLLVKTTTTSGKGKLTSVKYIERVDTFGGLPPTMTADAAHADKEERVAYRATYLFYAGS